MTWLIASLGTSPSVLTEALWFLETQKGLAVEGMTCVGTQASWRKAQEELFAPGGALERLRRELGKPEAWMTEGDGFSKMIAETMDNRDLEEAKAMDAAFRCAVREAQEDDDHDGPVIACISGGRKTMSSSLQQAMTLLARNEDWIFHVLLNLPQGIEESEVIRSGFGFPGDPAHPAFREVGVDAFEVPLVRLREFAASKKLDLADQALVQKLQKAVDEAVVPPRLELDLRDLRLISLDGPHGGLQLGPQMAMILAAYARANRPMDLQEARQYFHAILAEWEKGGYVAQSSKKFQTEFSKLRERVRVWFEEDPEYFDQQASRLGRKLEQMDPRNHIFRLRAYDVGVKGFAQSAYDGEAPLIRVIAAN